MRVFLLGLLLVTGASCTPEPKSPSVEVVILHADLEIQGASEKSFTNTQVSSSSTVTFTVKNVGNISAYDISLEDLDLPFDFSGGAYPGTGGTCGATIEKSETCEIVLEFSPSAKGEFDGEGHLYFHYDSDVEGVPNQATITMKVDGIGIPSGAEAYILISEGPYFSTTSPIGVRKDHIFTITNLGSVAATNISTGAFFGNFDYEGGSFPGTSGDCGATLSAGAICDLSVGFTPASDATYIDRLQINYDDGIGSSTSERQLQGTGT